MEIGFVILSHQNPGQLARLIGTLNRLYGDPPIACHHDTSQSAIDTAQFPPNVRFVTPSIRTAWGKWSLVEAVLVALRVLYDHADPDWVVQLSAADYPVMPAEAVRADLAASGADALADHRHPGMDAATAERAFGPRNPALGHYEAPANGAMLRNRYMGAQVWLPMIRWKSRRLGRRTFHLPFEAPNLPFTADFACYCGDQWFTVSRRAASALLHPTARERALQQHLRMRTCADECYYTTVLCNRPELTVQRHNRRFARWNGGGAHPATLTVDDLDDILASGAHFARKFAAGDPVLDRLDEILGLAPPVGASAA